MSTPARLLVALTLALPFATATAQQPAPAAAPAPAAQPRPVEEVLAEFRATLQRTETELVSKSMSFSTDEATAFWPVFKRYQDEKSVIFEAQIEAVRQYAANYDKLGEADATAYVQSLLDRDQRVHDLRVKYLAEFSRVIAPGKAARVIHISRRLGLAGQLKLASEIPLVR